MWLRECGAQALIVLEQVSLLLFCLRAPMEGAT
jgi:hypothetical protein